MGLGVLEVVCWAEEGGCYLYTDSTGCMGMVVGLMDVAGVAVVCCTGWVICVAGEIGVVAEIGDVLPRDMECHCTLDTCHPYDVHKFHPLILGMVHQTVGVLGRLGAVASEVVGNVRGHAHDLSAVGVAALPLSLSRHLAVD